MSHLPDELLKWDGKSNLTIGELKDENLYIQIVCDEYVLWNNSVMMKQCLPKDSTKTPCPPVVLLEMIHVPLRNRRQGLATDIIRFIDTKLTECKSSTKFAIGPLMGENDAIEKIAKKLTGYKRIMPWCLFKEFSPTL